MKQDIESELRTPQKVPRAYVARTRKDLDRAPTDILEGQTRDFIKFNQMGILDPLAISRILPLYLS